jgi:CMP-N-acetylneuraminic acid synthetase
MNEATHLTASTSRVLGVITARGGSKGLPRKNILALGGRPLLAWTAEAALRAERLTRVILSTDDEEIAATGQSCGLEVPFLRPAELATDETPTLPVLQHAVAALELEGSSFDAICLLQPTSPLRTAGVIDGCIQLLDLSGADAVATVLEVPAEYNPHWVYFQDSEGDLRLAVGGESPLPRRQLLPRAFHREGSVYVVRRDVLMRDNTLYGRRLVGYLMQPHSSINIDDIEDFRRAEQLMAARAAV